MKFSSLPYTSIQPVNQSPVSNSACPYSVAPSSKNIQQRPSQIFSKMLDELSVKYHAISIDHVHIFIDHEELFLLAKCLLNFLSNL